MQEDEYFSCLKQHSSILIQLEGKVLADILLNANASVVSMSLVPFTALYCRSAKEFLGIENGDACEKEVKDIRNGLKVFTDRYSKSKKMALETDKQQDETFRNMLRFPWMRLLNVHYNLGVYFDKCGKIIFDTHLINFYLNIPEKKGETISKHALIVGQNLGVEINRILVGHFKIENLMKQTTSLNPVSEYGFMDFNTNFESDFFCNDCDKETNLVLLHLLSTIGFVNNVLVPILVDKNSWLLRILYITVHNTIAGIKKIEQHFKQSKEEKGRIKPFNPKICTDEGISLLSSPFRNCMMHYDLIDKNDHPVIEQNWFDSKKPFFGLVESCFEGMSFDQYFARLYVLSQEVEEYLLSYFTFDVKDIHWDWD